MAILHDVSQGTKYLKDGEEKTRWQKLGVAFEKDGRITSVKLEALPIPNKEGEIWLNIFPKKDEVPF